MLWREPIVYGDNRRPGFLDQAPAEGVVGFKITDDPAATVEIDQQAVRRPLVTPVNPGRDITLAALDVQGLGAHIGKIRSAPGPPVDEPVTAAQEKHRDSLHGRIIRN